MGDEEERTALAALREQLEIDKLRAENRSFIERHFAAILTALVSLIAVVVTAGQGWLVSRNNQQEFQLNQIYQRQDQNLRQQEIRMNEINQKREQEFRRQELRLNEIYQRQQQELSKQDGGRDKVRLSNELAKFVLDNEKRINSKDPEDRADFGKFIEKVYPPDIAKIIFEYLTTISDDDEWRKALTAYISRTKLQNVYLFRITPTGSVDVTSLETKIRKEIFPSLKVYQRNVRSSRHTLFRGDKSNGRTSFLWMLEMSLYGSGSAIGGVEKVLAQMQEKLDGSASLSQAYMTSK